ncbi:MAG: hypothetical protein QOJ57_2344, partial [Thermoleophilaceae bacterium]|nr:hypothetical protein [Thermoleophilaceae bacterium]
MTQMTVEPTADTIEREGWCVIDDVVPGDELPGIREAVWREIRRQRAGWEQEVARIVSAGHQPPPRKVAQAQAVINHVPEVS